MDEFDRWQVAARHRFDWAPSSFLAGLAEPTLRHFISAGEARLFRANECLIVEGDADTDVFLILSACVKVTARLDERREALLAVRVAGDLVGELAAADGMRRSATVRACGRDPVAVLVLDRQEFYDLVVAFPAASIRLSAAISQKLRRATRRRVDYSGSPPTVRLARALVELADDYGQRSRRGGVLISVNLTRVELGTLVGVAEATAHRAMRELREKGLIVTEGRRPLVRDLAALRAVAQA